MPALIVLEEFRKRWSAIRVSRATLRAIQSTKDISLAKRTTSPGGEDECSGSHVLASCLVLEQGESHRTGKRQHRLAFVRLELDPAPMAIDLMREANRRAIEIRQLQVAPQEAEQL